MENRRGFTLVEVIVVLAVLAILAAVAIPLALRIFQVAAEDATRQEMESLKRAMVGEPNKLQGSFRSDFGFLGDMGRLPSTLDELFAQDSLPTFSFDNTKQAGAGWKGPYITGGFSGEEAEEFKKDQLGNDYTLTVDASGLEGTLTSNGPDSVPGNSDDITMAILPVETTATIRGSVKDSSGNSLANVPVDLHFPSNGNLTTVTATADSNGNYSFTSVPFGPRSVQVSSFSGVLVLSSSSVSISGNGENITFVVSNPSGSAVTVDTIIADFGPRARNPNYDRIRINGTIVDSGNNFDSQQPVSIIPTTISGSPTVNGPQRVFVDSADAQLPDIILGQGSPTTIQLQRFNRAMNGIPFTVTFLSGATAVGVVSFVP